jgi:hypothetical protein
VTLPKAATERRRRNVVPPSKTDRRLPTTGRAGAAPTPPVPLGAAGFRWWSWAWSTPQATAWNHEGFTESLAKRAQLEDIWTAVGNGEIAGDLTKILPLIHRLDIEFGLTPRSASALHMIFEEPPADAAPDTPDTVTDIRDRLKGLG